MIGRFPTDASKIAKELNCGNPRKHSNRVFVRPIQWNSDYNEWFNNVQDGSYQRQRLGSGE